MQDLEMEHIKLTWSGVTRLLQDFVASLDQANYNQPLPYKRIIAVARGGLPIASILSYMLEIREIGVVSVLSYDHQTKLANIRLNSTADPSLYNSRDTLLVDDIADSGRTMSILQAIYPQAARYALIAKPLGKHYVHACSEMVEQDLWVDFPWEVKRGTLIPPIQDEIQSPQ